MFKKMETWHWVALGIIAYLVYRWYKKNNGVKTVNIPVADVSQTTLEPGSEIGESTDPTIATEVTRVIGPNQY